MKKIAQKFSSFDEADEAEYIYYSRMTPEERLDLLLEMIIPEDPNEAIIQRSARVYPITELE